MMPQVKVERLKVICENVTILVSERCLINFGEDRNTFDNFGSFPGKKNINGEFFEQSH